MEKAYNISELRFEKKFLILTADNQTIKLRLKDISEKLFRASDVELNDYKISPSGYGIHWRMLDEDLSVNGLIKQFQVKSHKNQIHI
jgi:hypothetical protein